MVPRNLPAAADLVQTSGHRPLSGAFRHPALRRRALTGVAGALLVAGAVGCEKGKALAAAAAGGGEAEAPVPRGPLLDLTRKPDILFQVFGERDDPRMIPVAVLRNGRLDQIELDADGWKQFDALYTRSPMTISLYQDGQRVGDGKIRQGMWEKEGEPVYSLPSCRVLTPLSAITIGTGIKAGYTVELLASNATLGRARTGPTMSAEIANRAAREVAYGVGDRAGIGASSLDSLDFRAVAVHTGATEEPTLVASFIDPGASEGESEGTARHVFAIADRAGDRYAATFTHAVNGAASSATYRRYFDHLDVTGDGVDEIVLEGWQSGGDTYLMVLGFKDGKWTEVFRGRSSWCIEKEKR